MFLIYIRPLHAAAATTTTPSGAEQAFAKLKSMAGQWELTTPSGQKGKISYEVISDGHAVLERHFGMVSVYHLDGASVLMTHYCASGNQPRLRARQFGQTLNFEFVDVSNATSKSEYVSSLAIQFVSADEVRETWGFTASDRSSQEIFVLKRISTQEEKVNHMISWFEISVADLERATKFYANIFALDLRREKIAGQDMAFFPHTKGSISGALLNRPDHRPTGSANSVNLYMNGGDDLSTVLNRVATAGGKVILPKTQIAPDIGYMGIFEDTEGNHLSLYSPN